MYFQTRGLLLALRAGEPARLVQLLLLEINNLSFVGGRDRRIARIWQLIEGLLRHSDSPHLSAQVSFTCGMEGFLAGRWRAAREHLDRSEEMLRQHCVAVAAELPVVQMFGLASLFYLGEIRELGRRLPAVLQEVREYGDRLMARQLSLFQLVLVRLAADNAREAEAGWREVQTRLPADGFWVDHYLATQSGVWLKLYGGDGEGAWKLVSERWPAYAGSQLRYMQKIRVDMHLLRAAAALAAARTTPDPGPLLRLAAREVHQVEAEKPPWGDALARLLRAGLACARGDTAGARALLADAVRRLEEVDMGLHAAAARRRLGQLTGGEEGRKLIEEADAWMAAQQVRNPARMTVLLAPDCARSSATAALG
jgi:hypothetical protein